MNANLVLGGDINFPLQNVDKTGGTDISGSKNAIQIILEMSNNLNRYLETPTSNRRTTYLTKQLGKHKMQIRLLAYFEAPNSSH